MLDTKSVGRITSRADDEIVLPAVCVGVRKAVVVDTATATRARRRFFIVGVV